MEYGYRGRRTDTGEWVYGNCFQTELTGGQPRGCIVRDGVEYTVDPESVEAQTGGFISLQPDAGLHFIQEEAPDIPVVGGPDSATNQEIPRRILEAAIQHMADRAASYDSPGGERSMAATVEAFNAITGYSISETDGWLFMCFLKAVRSRQGAYKADNFEDLAAYAALAGESAAMEADND